MATLGQNVDFQGGIRSTFNYPKPHVYAFALPTTPANTTTLMTGVLWAIDTNPVIYTDVVLSNLNPPTLDSPVSIASINGSTNGFTIKNPSNDQKMYVSVQVNFYVRIPTTIGSSVWDSLNAEAAGSTTSNLNQYNCALGSVIVPPLTPAGIQFMVSSQTQFVLDPASSAAGQQLTVTPLLVAANLGYQILGFANTSTPYSQCIITIWQ